MTNTREIERERERERERETSPHCHVSTCQSHTGTPHRPPLLAVDQAALGSTLPSGQATLCMLKHLPMATLYTLGRLLLARAQLQRRLLPTRTLCPPMFVYTSAWVRTLICAPLACSSWCKWCAASARFFGANVNTYVLFFCLMWHTCHSALHVSLYCVRTAFTFTCVSTTPASPCTFLTDASTLFHAVLHVFSCRPLTTAICSMRLQLCGAR